MSDVKQAVINLFEQMFTREDEIKDLHTEIKDSLNIFCEEHEEFDPKALKDGYKFFKKLIKDSSQARGDEFVRDKIVELLIGD